MLKNFDKAKAISYFGKIQRSPIGDRHFFPTRRNRVIMSDRRQGDTTQQLRPISNYVKQKGFGGQWDTTEL